MTAKVRIKAGPIEFEYERETELAVADIKDLFTHIETLFKVPVLAEGGESHGAAPASGTPAEQNPPPPLQKLHINSVAAKLGGGSGSQLAVAAAAHLQLMEGKESFSRAELLKTMQAATLYYKKTMSNNLTASISTLVGDKFNQLGQDKYSLNSGVHGQLEAQLAQ